MLVRSHCLGSLCWRLQACCEALSGHWIIGINDFGFVIGQQLGDSALDSFKEGFVGLHRGKVCLWIFSILDWPNFFGRGVFHHELADFSGVEVQGNAV